MHFRVQDFLLLNSAVFLVQNTWQPEQKEHVCFYSVKLIPRHLHMYTCRSSEFPKIHRPLSPAVLDFLVVNDSNVLVTTKQKQKYNKLI